MSSHISILLIEDNPDDSDFFSETLIDIPSETFDLTSVTRLNEALSKLETQTFDIIFLDLALPDAHGLDGFTKLHQKNPTIPVVILTGLDDDKTALDIMRQGAQDYLVKGTIEPSLLNKTIGYAVERKRAETISQQAERMKVLAQAAVTTSHHINQPLTSLLGYCDLLLSMTNTSETSPETLIEFLNEIRESGIKIRDIVQKFERIEHYVTTPYVAGIDMLDLDASGPQND